MEEPLASPSSRSLYSSTCPRTPQRTVVVPKPDDVEALMAERTRLSQMGRYEEAYNLQQALEQLKEEEEARQLQLMADQHADETVQLEAELEAEFDACTAQWDKELTKLQINASLEQDRLQKKHVKEQQQHAVICSEEEMRYHPSRSLLEARNKEMHLRRQCLFAEANQTQRKADLLEERERGQSLSVLQARQDANSKQLNRRQHKEMDALENKLKALLAAAACRQQRQLQQLQHKIQAARLALQRKQGQERLNLEKALKGWMSTRLLGIPPNSSSAGHNLPASVRPGTAPVQQSRNQGSAQQQSASQGSVQQQTGSQGSVQQQAVHRLPTARGVMHKHKAFVRNSQQLPAQAAIRPSTTPHNPVYSSKQTGNIHVNAAPHNLKPTSAMQALTPKPNSNAVGIGSFNWLRPGTSEASVSSAGRLGPGGSDASFSSAGRLGPAPIAGH